MSKYKKNKAVALKYNVEEDASPVVIASGYGTVAEHIIDIAEKKGIPVFKDDSAASLLCMLEVGSNIPVELYEVVAAIYCKLIETSASIRGSETAAEAAISFFRWMTIFRLWLISGIKENIPPSGEKMEGETVALAKARRIWWSAYLGAQW